MKRRLNYGLTNDDAADAQLYASQTREIAEEREKQLIRSANLESHHRGAEVDIGFKHGNEMTMLKARQEERDGNVLNSFTERQEELERQLQVTGLRKTLRDISGRSGRDQDELEAVQKTLADFEYKNQQEIQTLEKQQAQEEQSRLDDMERRWAYVEQEREQENNARLEQQREQAAEVRESVTPINSNKPPPPSPAWEREVVIEQQNTPPLQDAFVAANREADRADYVEQERADQMANEPTQEFEQVATPIHSNEAPAPAPVWEQEAPPPVWEPEVVIEQQNTPPLQDAFVDMNREADRAAYVEQERADQMANEPMQEATPTPSNEQER